MPDIASAVLPRPETADEKALRRRSWTLALLTTTYFFSYMDRQILAILLEAIRVDLDLNDTQLGLLSGFAFAMFYATLGIPVARLADRYNRRNIISAALFIWSAMTALCGLATNFAQLLAARIGVGIGEAGSSPPSHSIIADLYPVDKRASAMAIFSLGVVLGAGLGTIVGGTIAYYYDWRTAFLAVGLPGVALAVIVRLFVIEPRRGLSDADKLAAEGDDMPTLGQGFVMMWRNLAARHLVMGVTVTALIGYALGAFGPAFYIRSFGMNTLEIAWYVAPAAALMGVISGIVGGKLADRFARRKGLHAQAWFVAWLKVFGFPCALLHYSLYNVYGAIGFFFLSVLFQASYLGPTFSMLQGLAPLKLRALWAAITLLVINLIGLGLGPVAIGVISDLYAPLFGEESLRYALVTGAAATPWAIWHYWRAGVYLKRQSTG